MENESLMALLEIGIVGSLLSLAIQAIQDKFGAQGNVTKLIAITGSIALGTLYWFLAGTEIWTAVLGVLGAASTVYAFVFSGKRKEDRESI